MKRVIAVLAALGAALGFAGTTASAGGPEWHVEPHGHVMLIGVEVEGGLVYFDRCVEFKKLRVPAHHNSIHTGPAGGSPFAMGALFHAGNWVIPLGPYAGLPFTGCESFSSPFPAP